MKLHQNPINHPTSQTNTKHIKTHVHVHTHTHIHPPPYAYACMHAHIHTCTHFSHIKRTASNELQLTFLASLYSRMSWWRVSQFGTQPINPLFGDSGMTEYRWMDKSFSWVSLEFSSRVFTKPKSCKTKNVQKSKKTNTNIYMDYRNKICFIILETWTYLHYTFILA